MLRPGWVYWVYIWSISHLWHFLGLSIHVLHLYILSWFILVRSKQTRHGIVFSKAKVMPSYISRWSHCIVQLFSLLLGACSWEGRTPNSFGEKLWCVYDNDNDNNQKSTSSGSIWFKVKSHISRLKRMTIFN